MGQMNHCQVQADTLRYLAHLGLIEAQQEEIHRRAAELIATADGLELIEEEFPNVRNIERQRLVVLLNARFDASRTAADIDVIAAYKVAAHKLAAKQLDTERRHAEEGAAIDRYERRCDAWA